MASMLSAKLDAMLKIRNFIRDLACKGFVFFKTMNLLISIGSNPMVPQLVPTVICEGDAKQQLSMCPARILPK